MAGRCYRGREMFFRLLVLFVTIPMIELILFLTVGERIGLAATVGVVVLTGFLGAWLTKREGLRTLQRYRSTLSGGRLPHDEVLEGILVLMAGAVLLTPGFLTDAAGFLLLVPSVRAGVVRWLKRSLEGRVRRVVSGPDAGNAPADPEASGRRPAGKVIDVEVVDE